MDLDMQLRAAEARRAELERQHQEALQALRGCGPSELEARQSRVRELEKKVALETVRCEELQLELASTQRARLGTSSMQGGVGGMSTSSNMNMNMAGGHSWSNKGGCTAGLATSVSSHALGECSPPISPITMSHTTPSIYPGHTAAVGHNAYSSSAGSYLPSSNPVSVGGYNTTSQYNSLGHTPSYKIGGIGTTMNSLGHHSVGIGSTLGQTSVLGTSLTQNPLSTIGTGLGTVGSTLSSSLGTSIVPSSLGTSMVQTSIGNTNFSNTLPPSSYNNPSTFSNSATQYGLSSYSNPITTSYSTSNNVTFSNPLSSQFNSLPMSIKLKQMDDVDITGTRRVATPVTPHPPAIWGTTMLSGISDLRPRIINDSGGLDSDWAGLHSDRGFLNGHNASMTDGQVDMLDIPGKGRCSVYIARFSYDPEPEAAEEELSIQAGDYLLVWGDPTGTGGYLDAELLDGRRGLVPAHFVQRLIGDDLLEFHQAVLSTLREEEINQENFAADVQRLNELAEMAEAQEDDGPEGETVPAPRQLTLERQLNKSVLISWTAPENVGPNQIDSYHVYVDGVLKATVKASERTRALVEGVDSNRPHRISVRSVTANRRTSRDAACTMIIGRDTHQLGPSAVRASNITSTSAVISWLPANSNHQHVVCVNNVEVRTVKPGVYRHTITGLAPNTQYRVTVRAKHHRSAQNVANVAEELPMPAAAHTDFRTLPKGLPDPPSDIMVEPGPQDGTLLVTWHPLQPPHHHSGSTITGYAVYADGKKVTDVDSPTGDHALIDISKLLGLNPRHVTVRTKARDSQSADSAPTPIPTSVLRGGAARARQQPHQAVMPPHLRQQMQGGGRVGQQGQQIIEPEENLSDKEIFPNQNPHRQQGSIPSIAQRCNVPEITKENYEAGLSEDELLDSGSSRRGQQQQRAGQQQQRGGRQQTRGGTVSEQQSPQSAQPPTQQGQQGQYYQQQQAITSQSGQQMQQRGGGPLQSRGGQAHLTQGQARAGMAQQGNPGTGQPPYPQKRARWFVALFDYDPATMSPNPDACDEELPFSEGDTIKVWGDKDADGFYWGECRGRRGYVPHNMVMELEGNQNRDRWGDIYANTPVKRMVALYDYDPQELSPNVDAEVELSFTTGQIINVYGEMDDDGFYMAEIDGVRGLVPSNFLTEASDQYGAGQASRGSQPGIGTGSRTAGGRVGQPGPGARGPPPPPRERQGGQMQQQGQSGQMQQNVGQQRNKDACLPVYTSQLDSLNTSTTPNTLTEHQQGGRGLMRQGGNQQQQQGVQNQSQFGQQQSYAQQQQFNQQNQQQYNQQNQQFGQQQNQQFGQQQNQQQHQTSSLGSSLFSSLTGQTQQNQQQGQTQQQSGFQNRIQHKGVPQVLPTNVMGGQTQSQQGQQGQQGMPGMPQGMPGAGVGANVMQKLNEITAPGGDILSKGKELIFMKFGLGGK